MAGAPADHTLHSKLVLLSLGVWESVRSPRICLHPGLLANSKQIFAASTAMLTCEVAQCTHPRWLAYTLNTRKHCMQSLTSQAKSCLSVDCCSALCYILLLNKLEAVQGQPTIICSLPLAVLICMQALTYSSSAAGLPVSNTAALNVPH